MMDTIPKELKNIILDRLGACSCEKCAHHFPVIIDTRRRHALDLTRLYTGRRGSVVKPVCMSPIRVYGVGPTQLGRLAALLGYLGTLAAKDTGYPDSLKTASIQMLDTEVGDWVGPLEEALEEAGIQLGLENRRIGLPAVAMRYPRAINPAAAEAFERFVLATQPQPRTRLETRPVSLLPHLAAEFMAA